MSLDSLRQKVIFQNSIDVWIAVCHDKGLAWNNADGYKKFISYLRKNNLGLKMFTLCAHEAGAVDQEKTDFVDGLAQIKDRDPDAATYTIRLTDGAMDILRSFELPV